MKHFQEIPIPLRKGATPMSEATRAENATSTPYDLEAHYQELEQKITSAGIPADLGRVRAAFECADRAHSGQ